MKNILMDIKNKGAVYHDLIESVNNIIYVLDENLRITYISPVIERITGYRTSELIEHSFDDFFHAYSPDKSINNGIDINRLLRFVGKDGDQKFFVTSRLKSVKSDTIKGKIGILVEQKDIVMQEQIDNQLFKKAVELSPVSIIISNHEGIIEYVNPGFEKMTGFIFDSVVGQNVTILKSGIHTEDFYRKIWETLDKGRSWKGDIQNMKQDGSLYWEYALISPITGHDNTIIHYIKIAENISEQKSMMDMLIRSYDFIENVMNNANPIFVLDVKNNFVLTNQIFSKITGYASCEIVGKNISHIFEGAYLSGVTDIITRSIHESTQISNYETMLKRQDGANRVITMNLSPLLQEGGIAYLVGTMEDITVRKESEIELKKLSLAVEQSPASVVITDVNGVIEYVNARFTKLTGYSYGEIVGQKPNILKSGEHDSLFYENLWQTVLSGREWVGEFLNKKKNGDLYWEAATISPIRNDNNEITHLLGVKEDITDKKLAQEALLISEETLRKRNQVIEQDLKYAQKMVKKILPARAPRHKNFKIEYCYKPVDAIGGDFFSFKKYGGNGLGIFIGDVVGHGVSAALFLSLVKYETDKISKKLANNPAQFMTELNKQLTANKTLDFLTAIYGYFEVSKNGTKFSYTRAGHPAPILYRSKDKSVSLMKSSGKPIGLIHNLNYTQYEIQLDSGDQVFLYTDGVNETFDKGNHILGYEGLKKIINRYGGDDLQTKLLTVLEDVSSYRGGKNADDDIILIGIEVC